MAGGTGSSIANGLLPPTPNTGGAGGGSNQNSVGSGGAGRPGYVVLTVLSSPGATPGVPSYTGQQIVPISMNAFGQTINSQNSYITAASAGGTITVQVVLNQTNHPNTTFQPVYFLDGSAPVWTGVFLTTDGNGSGAASFTIAGVAPGSHGLAVEINNTPSPGDTYYVNVGNNGNNNRIIVSC